MLCTQFEITKGILFLDPGASGYWKVTGNHKYMIKVHYCDEHKVNGGGAEPGTTGYSKVTLSGNDKYMIKVHEYDEHKLNGGDASADTSTAAVVLESDCMAQIVSVDGHNDKVIQAMKKCKCIYSSHSPLAPPHQLSLAAGLQQHGRRNDHRERMLGTYLHTVGWR